MVGTALEPGTLVLRGVTVQLPGTTPKEFTLPLATEEEESKQAKKRGILESEFERIKVTGLGARPWQREALRRSGLKADSKAVAAGGGAVRFLECKVVPAEPLLRVRRSSLTHGALMLYDGEK